MKTLRHAILFALISVFACAMLQAQDDQFILLPDITFTISQISFTFPGPSRIIPTTDCSQPIIRRSVRWV